MTLYSPFDYSSLPMLHPLLYLSPSMTPLRPYSIAVLGRIIHPNINYGHPSPRWFITSRNPESKQSPVNKQDPDPTEKQSTAEKQNAVDSDPRIVFGETEFQTIREKYNMPKYVLPQL
jgi:hypothetical protein